MRKILLSLFILMNFISYLNAQSTLYSGALTGELKGQITVGETTKDLNGKVSGEWSASMEDNGSITGSAKGTFGAISGDEGISGSFQVNYDPVTMTLNGTWTLPGLKTPNTISFSIDKFTGQFKGPISGTIPTKDGGVPFSGTLTLNFQGYPKILTGNVNTGLNVKVGWAVLDSNNTMSCGSNYVTDDQGKVAGKWQVQIFTDQSITGKADGIFKGTAQLNLDLTNECVLPSDLSTLIALAESFFPDLSSVKLTFPYFGTWTGELQGSMESGLFFGGSWTETYDSENYNSYGEGFENINISNYTPADENTGKFGGSIIINIDLNNTTATYIPVNGKIQGGGETSVNLRELSREQGICDKYNALMSQFSKYDNTYSASAIPTTQLTIPDCAKTGDVCNCLPTSVKVRWWVEDASIDGKLTW